MVVFLVIAAYFITSVTKQSSMLATVPDSCGGARESAHVTTLSAPGTQRMSVVNTDTKQRCRC